MTERIKLLYTHSHFLAAVQGLQLLFNLLEPPLLLSPLLYILQDLFSGLPVTIPLPASLGAVGLTQYTVLVLTGKASFHMGAAFSSVFEAFQSG